MGVNFSKTFHHELPQTDYVRDHANDVLRSTSRNLKSSFDNNILPKSEFERQQEKIKSLEGKIFSMDFKKKVDDIKSQIKRRANEMKNIESFDNPLVKAPPSFREE